MGLLGVTLVAAAFGAGLRAGRGARLEPPQFAVLSYRPQAIFRAAYAPDNKTIVYSSALQGNKPEIFTRSPDYPEPRSLGLTDANLLSVSAKGDLAVLLRARFIRHRLFVGTLARVPLGGGAPREILDDVREADWDPSGGDLAIIRDNTDNDRIEYPAGTVLCETNGYFSDLRFSHDGRYIAFFEHPYRWDDRGGIAVVEVATKKRRDLAGGYWGEQGIAWTPGDREILYSAGKNYDSFMVLGVNLEGNRRVALDAAGGMVIHDVAPDGHWLASRDDLGKDARLRQGSAGVDRDISWLDQSDPSGISADGKMVLFSEESGVMGDHYAVCLRHMESFGVVRLGEGGAGDLSPDGKWAIGVVPSSPSEIRLYPTGAGQPRKLDVGNLTGFSSARFFPDGRRLAVAASELGAPSRCYVIGIDGGKPLLVSPVVCDDVFVSPDGAAIASQARGGALHLFPAAGGEVREVGGTHEDDLLAGWTRDGQALLVHGLSKVPAQLDRIEITTGERRSITTFGPPDLEGVLQLRAGVIRDDGEVILYSVRRHRSTLFEITGAGR